MTVLSEQSLTEERREMRAAVADFLDRHADPRRIREVIGADPGHDVALWRRGAAELGLAAMLVPERCGGLGLGVADAAVVLEEFGRRLVPSPLLTTLVAAVVLDRCGDPGDLLARIAGGTSVSVAVAEPGGGRASRATTAGGGRLSGAKSYVPHGAAVDVLLVAAPDGLYVVDADAPGVSRRDRIALDHTRRLADVEFADAPATQVGGGASAVELLDQLMLVALAVESVAAARASLEMTVEYLKVRHQFGRPIGSFQALKHRCADLVVALEGAEATAWYAVEALAQDSSELPVVAPLAKVVAADAFWRVATEAVQLHGGIGFTFDHDAHLYLKRAKANQLLFGSGSQLRERVARLAGL